MSVDQLALMALGWISNVVSGFWQGLEWPHAFLITSAVVISSFKEEIRKLIPDLNELGPGGLKFSGKQSPAQSEHADEPRIAIPAGEPSEGAVSAPRLGRGIPIPPIAFQSTVDASKEFIANEVSDLSDPEAKDYLRKWLAFTRVMWDFENIYTNIFGGQIKYLQILNDRVGMGLSIEEARGIWEAHQTQQKPHLDNWTFEQYLNFLKVRTLIEEIDGRIHIHVRGKDFLLWMTQYSRTFDRAW
ncbi:hypothetical protein ACUTAH_02920 [Metapseudomonas furukawaii]|uniref:hypothetical protein n=1 Tax=Metapseudomonas furukawaii TaxID=1149133 RepID=UPI004045FD60